MDNSKTWALWLGLLVVGCDGLEPSQGDGSGDIQQTSDSDATAVAAVNSARKTFYVAKSGRDQGHDGSYGRPWRTIGYAVSAATPVRAGDTIIVRPGTYVETITLGKSGNAGGHITLKAEGRGVVLKDPDPNNGHFKEGVIQSAGKAYWIIEGFRIEKTSWAGISLRDARHMIVRNNHTYETGASGIIIMPDSYFGGGEAEVTSSDIKILNNTIERANWLWAGVGDSRGVQEAMSIWGVDRFEVAYNRLDQGKREGIDVKVGSRHGSVHHNSVRGMAIKSGRRNGGYQGGPAIYIEGSRASLFDVSVYANSVYDNTASGIVVADEIPNQGDVRDIRIYNNIIYNNGVLGENAGMGIGITSNVSNVEVYHNTVAKNVNSIYVDGADYTRGRKPSNIVVTNNIFANHRYRAGIMRRTERLTVQYNIFNTSREFPWENQSELTNFTQSNNLKTLDVRFKSLGGNDYRLNANSEGVNAATGSVPGYVRSDHSGRSRWSSPDMGAFESH